MVVSCGKCHPGGGPLEYDRHNRRYDKAAGDPNSGIRSVGKNSFDGDYFKAKWAETGVIEADCLICHLPAYNNQKRKAQITSLNFRWAATAGAAFGKIEGKVANGEIPNVIYNPGLFTEDGRVTLKIVRDTPTKNCLFCHQETDWKKKGASYSPRTDVHIRAGLRCIDCHVTGSRATDERIRGKEVHQIGKGDDPGGFVRNDLNNTMRRCEDCHSQGLFKAPVAKHRGLPPRHMEKIACQTCHIPTRDVKAALIQDSTVFNASPRIPKCPKMIWSFYGPDIKPWNYYGEVDSNTAEYKPLHTYAPVVGWYKGKIYPLTRLFSVWVGIQEEGKTGLGQPYMKDVFMMWKKHLADPDKNFPQLKEIKDDNLDGFPEVNRPEEIKALLAAVTSMLKAKGKFLEGKEVVFVDGNRYTADGSNWKIISKKPHEYSPYGSVFKFSHDITPARNALGAKGCTDCHSSSSDFFFKEIMVRPFDQDGMSVKQQNADFMGYSPLALRLTAFQHEILKPFGLWSLLAVFVLVMLHYVIFGPKRVKHDVQELDVIRFGTGERIIHYSLLVLFGIQAITGLISFSALPFSSGTLGEINTIHHYSGYLFMLDVLLVFGIWFRDVLFQKWDWEWLKKFGGYFGYRGELPSARFNAGQKVFFWFIFLMVVILGMTGLIIIWARDGNLRLIAHPIHNIAAFIGIIAVIVHAYLGSLANPGTLRSIFEGNVSSGLGKEAPPSQGSKKNTTGQKGLPT